MTVRKVVEAKSVAKSGMTLGEVGAFVQEAMRSGADPEDMVAAQVGFGGGLRMLRVTHAAEPGGGE